MRTVTSMSLILILLSCGRSDSQLNDGAGYEQRDGSWIVYYKLKTGRNKKYLNRVKCPDQKATNNPNKCLAERAKQEWTKAEEIFKAKGVKAIDISRIKDWVEHSSDGIYLIKDKKLIELVDSVFPTSIKPFPKLKLVKLGGNGGGSSTLPVADSSTAKLKLNKALVWKEMYDARKIIRSSRGTVDACLGNAYSVNYWSDIVFHYYCQLDAMRACFTYAVRSPNSYLKKKNGQKYSIGRHKWDQSGTLMRAIPANEREKQFKIYEAAFYMCMGQFPDGSKYTPTPTISGYKEFKNYFNGKKPGVNYKQRREVFKHVMFTVYAKGGVGTFDRKDEDEVINKFYGVTNRSNCRKRLRVPRRNLSFDKLYRKRGEHCGLSGSGGTTTPGTCTRANRFDRGCWFVGQPGKSCDEVCKDSAPFKKYDTKTEKLDARKCESLSTKLGHTVPTGGTFWSGACRKSLACAINSRGAPYFCTTPAKSDVSHVGRRRICACKKR